MKKLLIVVDFQNDFIDGALGFPKALTLVDLIKNKIEEYNENNDDIINLVKSLEIDLDAKIMCYISYKGNQEELKEELEIAVKLLESKEIGFYNLKSLLLELKDVKNKDQVLDFILKDTGITKEFVLEFANSNMNATKAAKVLYMHRNTIIYKLDKLLALKDFDLKSFIDMHILYSLSRWNQTKNSNLDS